ncbi:MAG: peptidase S41 [Flavobacteriales bacterium]|nr:MAG: peptidase S41 [Flavobacteriales bacterium]
MKKLKALLIILTIGISSVISFSFVDSYFEISKNLDIFATLFRELNIYYVDETQPGELMKDGIDAMLGTLDPYTNYIPESEIEDYRFMTTGQYGGIGSVIRKRDDYVIIAEPYENSPTTQAGLMAGDIILEVDGKSAEGKTTEEMSHILKGQPGTSVKIKIKRDDETVFEKTIIRQEIKIKDVPYYGMVDDSIGYIKLNGFTETASKELKEAFKDLKENHGMKSAVIDLRGNGGGLLREAVNIVNIFAEKGQKIVETKGRVKDWDRIHRAINTPLDLEMPITVLIGNGSASASEIVSGALQDIDRAVIIGRKSFGKGLVQQTKDLSYNAKLKLTVAKYYIPSGRCIQRIDYSNRNKNGGAEAIPDSLISTYKTNNGRVVKDGAGILPDIAVTRDKRSNISGSLLRKMLIFDFATQYRKTHDSIPAANEFTLTEKEFDGFVDFIKDKEYDYTTKTEKLLDDFEKSAEKEKYLDDVKKEYETLKKKVQHNKNEDLKTFRDEIKKLIENEICSRYYYQKGRIEYSLASDPDVLKAIEVLNDKKFYASVLDGSYKAPSKSDDDDEIEEE